MTFAGMDMACPVHESFDPLDPAYLADPYAVPAGLRADTPVFFAPSIGMWVVTRYADIDAIFRDPVRFSAVIAQEPLVPLADEARAVLAGGFRASPTMSNCDPPQHGRIRAHLNTAFSPRRIAVVEPQVRAEAEQLVDAMAARPGRADLVAGLAFPLPAHTIFRLIGFPDADTEMLKSWCTDRLYVTWGRPDPAVQVSVAEHMTSVVAWRRVTTEPVEIGGVPVPQGAKLLLLLGSANHDPGEFPEPERFDIGRANARNHLAFGKGIHFCLGATLARMQVRIVLELLTTRLPTRRLVPGQRYSFAPNVSFRGPERLEVCWDTP